MLDHLGHPEAARKVERAAANELASRTGADELSTTEVGDRLASHLA
jgi:3-isopropylmalate dehydrogenase